MRIRSTKPEFWRSERIASVSWDARLVLKGLESYVDDNGVGKDDLALIVADVFPRDLSRNPTGTLQKVSEAISSLSEAGLLWRYEAAGTKLLFVSFWESIQRIEKPSKGRFPRPDGTLDYRDSDIGASFPEPSRNTPVALRPGTGEQGNRGTGEQGTVPLPADAGSGSAEPTAQTLVAEWIDHCGQRPPGRVVGHIAREVGLMLGEGIPYPSVRSGLQTWQQRGLHPSTLASVVHEVASQNGGKSRRQAETDGLFERAFERAAQYDAQEAAR